MQKKIRNVTTLLLLVVCIVCVGLYSLEILDSSNPTIVVNTFLLVISSYITTQFINQLLQADVFEEKQQQLYDEMVKRTPVQYLYGQEVTKTMTALVEKDLDVGLKAVVFGIQKSPTELTKNLANILKKRKDTTLIVVLVLETSSLSSEQFIAFEEAIVSAYDTLYTDEDNKQVFFYVNEVDKAIGVDTYIVDDKHIVFNVTDNPEQPKPSYRAVLLENAEANVINSFESWFNSKVCAGYKEFATFKASRFPPETKAPQ